MNEFAFQEWAFVCRSTMTPQQIVIALMKVTGKNQGELAKALGVSQPTVSRWVRGGKVEVENRDKVLALARKKGVINSSQEFEEQTVAIVGYVGAGGILTFEEGKDPFAEAPMPPKGATSHTVAVRVNGDSMAGQLEDGWIVYYEDLKQPPTEELNNRLCVVGLADGRVLIKWLVRGRTRGSYDLRATGGSVLLDQHVVWAAPVTWIQPS